MERSGCEHIKPLYTSDEIGHNETMCEIIPLSYIFNLKL